MMNRGIVTEPGQAPKVAVPPNGTKHSPNLAKWLNANRRAGGRPSVYRNIDGLRHIGWLEDDGWFSGARLWRVLGDGRRVKVFAFPPAHGPWFKEADFWDRYEAIGRCAIDEAHTRHFIGDDTRWREDGDTRECLWCGAHRQERHRWQQIIEREGWRPVALAALANPHPKGDGV